jgi:hypothetical protein
MRLQGTINQAGKKAYSFLVSEQRGQVLAVFSKAIYLLTEQGEIFWLAGNGAPKHDRCAVVSPFIPPQPDGVSFSVEESRLIIDHAFAYEIDPVGIWAPPETKCILEPAELVGVLKYLVLQLDCSQARGFGAFLPVIQALWQEMRIPDLHYTDPLLQSARPKVLNLARACLDGNAGSISKQAEMLVGLGAGLTPSGDDLVGGVLFAIRTLQTYYSGTIAISLDFPIENYGSRTHPISFTLLKDLADGSAVEPLHQIINNLLAGTSISCINSFVSQLTDIGHSTGWDLLTGLVTGLLLTHGNHCFAPSLQIEQGTIA